MQDYQGLRPFRTVKGTGESEIVISKSRFLGYCVPVSDEKEAQQKIAAIRKQHWEARHYCYALRLSKERVSRSSDDGEPSGTAGMPILNVLAQKEVENVLCVVVRYFGGILLGTGGLVRAYTKAAAAALEHAGVLTMRLCERVTIALSYPSYHALEPVIRSYGHTTEAEYAEAVTLHCTLPSEASDDFLAIVTERTDGAAQILREGFVLSPYPEAVSLR